MGFLSKIWKGVKKGFKAIFKPIKKVFKSFGKFMGKLGIAGQIALMFIPIPGMGFIMGKLGQAAQWAVKGISNMGAIGKAVGTVLGKGVEFASMAKAGFDTVSNAVTGFFKTTGKWIGGKLGMAQYKGLTWDKAWSEYSQSLTNSWEKLGSKASEFWDTDIKGALEPGRLASLESNAASDFDVSRTGINPNDTAFSGEGVIQNNASGFTENLQMSPSLNVEVGSPAQLQGLDSTTANVLGVSTTAPQMSNAAFSGEAAAGVMQSTALPGGPAVPKSLLERLNPFNADNAIKTVKELPGAMAKNVAMTAGSQAILGSIQGDPEVDMSPLWGARRGAGIEDFTASIGYQPTNYQQYVVDSTSNSIVPPQFQQYGGGTNFWEQLMAQYNRPVSATA